MNKTFELSFELIEGLVNRTVNGVKLMAVGETSDEVEKMMRYPSDLRTLLTAAKNMNEPETQKFLMVLTSILATANPLYLRLAKKLLNNFTDKLMAAVVMTQKIRGNEPDCDGNCDDCSEEKLVSDINKLDPIGRA